MIDRISIKERAKQGLSGHWNSLLLAALIIIAVTLLSNITTTDYIRDMNGKYVEIERTTAFSTLVSFFVLPVFQVGMCRYFLNHNKYEEGSLRDTVSGFENYASVLGGMLWVKLFTFLWSMLFVIPGIVKGIAYSMTPYVLAENPKIGFREAIKVSMALTYGKKGDIFVFYLSFFGWTLLCALTFGLLGFYVIPYMNSSEAYMYEQLKTSAISEGRIPAEVFASDGANNYGSNNYYE